MWAGRWGHNGGNMLHANDVQNQRKQAKMAHRLKRGVLAVNETNSGQQGKQLVFAQRLSEIRRVDVDSKLSGGKLKRTWAWTLRDGSIYTLPDDAVIVHQPS